MDVALGEKVEKTISITNTGSLSVTLNITQENISQLVLVRNDSITLNPGETKTLSLAFVDNNKTGIFTGKILVGSIEVPVTINIMTKKLLFDVGVDVLNLDSSVSRWGKLNTKITMIPRGDSARMDVKLNYVIKDYNNNIYMNKTEEVLVDSNTTIDRSFGLGSLKEGNYTIGVQLIYPGGVASASSNFQVTKAVIIGEILYYALLGLILSSIMLVISLIIIHSRREHEKLVSNY